MAQAKLDSGPAEARWSTGQRGKEFGAGRHREEERKEGDGADGVGRSVSGRVRKGKRGWVAPTCGPERGEGVSEEWLAGGYGCFAPTGGAHRSEGARECGLKGKALARERGHC